MKYIPTLFLLLVFWISACQNPDVNNDAIEATEQPAENEAEAPTIKGDWPEPSPKIIEEEPNEFQYEETGDPVFSDLLIYSLYPMEHEDLKIPGFVPLTDWFRFSEDPDSQVVANQYLGDANIVNENYHHLTDIHRKRFLSKLKIEEDENIYVINFHTNTLLEYSVKNTPIMAMLSPYGPTEEIFAYDYMIGFELPKSDVEAFGYSLTYIYTGKSNPFNSDKMKWIKWMEMDSTLFPTVELSRNDSFRTRNFRRGSAYQYFQDGLHYMVQDLLKGGIAARQLLVADSASGTIGYTKIYYESEGTYLDPLGEAERPYSEDYGQWTGQLIKGKPPIISGFTSHSFGCELLEFISESEPSIRVRCDNRH